MISKAKAKYIRTSPTKARLVIDLIKGKTVDEANAILDTVNKGASSSIKKVLNSAFSNANFNKQEKYLSKDVIISQIKVDGGPMLMRYRAATMGRATPIRHRTAHIYLELEVTRGKLQKKTEKTVKKNDKTKVKAKTAKKKQG